MYAKNFSSLAGSEPVATQAFITAWNKNATPWNGKTRMIMLQKSTIEKGWCRDDNYMDYEKQVKNKLNNLIVDSSESHS